MVTAGGLPEAWLTCIMVGRIIYCRSGLTSFGKDPEDAILIFATNAGFLPMVRPLNQPPRRICMFASGRCFHKLSPFVSLLLIMLFIPLNAWSVEPGQVLYEGSFSPSDLVWQSDAQGTSLPVLPQTRALAQPGLPNVPVRELLLLVPMDMEVSSAWVEPLQTHIEKLSQPLPTADPYLTDEGVVVGAATMKREGGGTFPAQWGEFGGSHIWRGYQLVAVNVFPLREVQDQSGAAVEFLDSYAVRVEMKPRAGEVDFVRRERFVPGEAESNAKVLQDLVANPENIPSYQRDSGVVVTTDKGDFQPTAAPSLLGSGVSYLIITNDALATEFQRMADFKTAQGIPTMVVTREQIAASYRNGADIQETMRMYIREAYQKWGLEYVLLGGDSDILPPRYVDNSYYPTVGSTMIPVDLYFACLDGNWNLNGNSQFGEPAVGADPGDACDFAEEVYLGRATVSSLAQASTFVDKVIAYETTAVGAGWPDRVLFAAEVLFPSEFTPGDIISLDGAQFADQQVNDLISQCTDMDYMRMYETDQLYPRDANLTRAALIDTLDNGRYGIFNQIGHGYYFNMSVGDANFMTGDADALVNGDHTFLIFALNCASGAFDNSCLLERFVQNPNGGAICALGSARAAFPYNSNNYQQEFFNQLYCNNEFRVGRTMALSRLPFLGSTANNYVDRWTFENYTLLGDPTLAIWTGSPEYVALNTPNSLDLGQQTVYISATVGGYPVEGALACLAMDGVDYAYGFTNASGIAALSFLAGQAGDAVLTVTGENMHLTTKTIPVVPATPYLTLDDMAFVENGTLGSSGNGNGVMEAGETVALTATMLETGGGSLTNLTGTLTSTDPGVTISAGTTTFPNVAAGGSTTAASAFIVTFDPTVVDGSAVAFQLTVTSGTNSAVSDYLVEISAPKIEPVALDWQDTTYGNGNDFIDSQERLVLTCQVKNYGFGRADLVTGHLRTDSANVAIYDSLATWTNLDLMAEAAGSLTYSMALIDASRAGSAYILFEDNYGRTYRHDFTLDRPDTPAGILTDTSEGADVISLSWTPPASPGTYGYHVYRAQSEFGQYSRINTDLVVGTSYFRDEGLNLLTEYFYKVVAVDSSLVPSGYSVTIAQSTAPPDVENFPVEFGKETSSHLAVGDVDGDGINEIVLAADEIYVWHANGQELLDGDANSQTLGVFTNLGSDFEPAGVALAELNHQPGQEIIASEQGNAFAIHIFKHDGSELPGWPQQLGTTSWNWATPAVGDIDGDGEPEIVVNTLNGITWAWHVDGTEVRDGDLDPGTNGVFYTRDGSSSEWCMSSPALYDLDGDGAKDIIFGTRNDSSGLKRLMAIKYDGSDVPGFPRSVSGPIACSPAVADLNNDGMVEIIFYTGWSSFYVIQADGTDYPGFPINPGFGVNLSWVTSPAVGDLDGDGQLEIVFADNVTGLDSRLIAVDTDVAGGTSGDILAGWPVALPGSSEGSPVIGDIDGDGIPEVIHGIGGGDESAPDNMYAFHADGTPVAGFPISLDGPGMPSAVICDLDQDSDVDIVYGGWGRKVHVWDMPFAYDPTNVYWPTFHGNMKRDGVYLSRALVDVPDGGDVPSNTFLVKAPYPNPFNPRTSIKLFVPRDTELSVGIYDLKGRRVRDLYTGDIGLGWHTLIWDGNDDSGSRQASGIYFMRAVSREGSQTYKLTLVK